MRRKILIASLAIIFLLGIVAVKAQDVSTIVDRVIEKVASMLYNDIKSIRIESDIIPNNVEDIVTENITFGSSMSTIHRLNSVASSTPTYLATSTEPTTMIFSIGSAEQLDLNIQFQASSTATRLDWNYEFSNDRIDWFGEDSKTITSDTVTTHGAATTTHRWTPGLTTIARKNLSIDNINGEWIKISFRRGVTYENGTLWAEVRGLQKGY